MRNDDDDNNNNNNIKISTEATGFLHSHIYAYKTIHAVNPSSSCRFFFCKKQEKNYEIRLCASKKKIHENKEKIYSQRAFTG